MKNSLQMQKSFTAIDFETAYSKPWSICQVGIVRVENLIITEQLSILVQPPNNYYWDKFIKIHGITPEQTANAPTFDIVWKQIETYITNQNVVAHFGFGFDFRCLKKTLEYYNLSEIEYTGHCTFKIYKSNLSSLANKYSIPLTHHDALSDALACAELFKLYLENKM